MVRLNQTNIVTKKLDFFQILWAVSCQKQPIFFVVNSPSIIYAYTDEKTI